VRERPGRASRAAACPCCSADLSSWPHRRDPPSQPRAAHLRCCRVFDPFTEGRQRSKSEAVHSIDRTRPAQAETDPEIQRRISPDASDRPEDRRLPLLARELTQRDELHEVGLARRRSTEESVMPEGTRKGIRRSDLMTWPYHFELWSKVDDRVRRRHRTPRRRGRDTPPHSSHP